MYFHKWTLTTIGEVVGSHTHGRLVVSGTCTLYADQGIYDARAPGLHGNCGSLCHALQMNALQ